MFTLSEKQDLMWSMQFALLTEDSITLNESIDYNNARDFILNEATYEQLLNICFPQYEDIDYNTKLMESLIVLEFNNLLSERKQPKKDSAKAAFDRGLAKKAQAEAEKQAAQAKEFSDQQAKWRADAAEREATSQKAKELSSKARDEAQAELKKVNKAKELEAFKKQNPKSYAAGGAKARSIISAPGRSLGGRISQMGRNLRKGAEAGSMKAKMGAGIQRVGGSVYRNPKTALAAGATAATLAALAYKRRQNAKKNQQVAAESAAFVAESAGDLNTANKWKQLSESNNFVLFEDEKETKKKKGIGPVGMTALGVGGATVGAGGYLGYKGGKAVYKGGKAVYGKTVTPIANALSSTKAGTAINKAGSSVMGGAKKAGIAGLVGAGAVVAASMIYNKIKNSGGSEAEAAQAAARAAESKGDTATANKYRQKAIKAKKMKK